MVQSKPRAEAYAREMLRRQGFDAYYPTEVRKRLVRRAVVALIAPLFPSYLFVDFDRRADRWEPIANTRGVRRLMTNADAEPIPLPPGVAATLRERCQRPVDDSTEIVALFAPGDTVRITAGPFEGHAAPVTRRDNGMGRVAVLLRFLGRQQEIFVNAADCAHAG